jgi:glutaminyl-peptide cyclotransferase
MPLPKSLLVIFAILLATMPLFAAPSHPCTVLTKLPHSTENYTEGFFFLNGRFYEGTGREGHSAILVTDPATGKVLQRHEIPPQYFGEGIIDFGPNLIEWTWQTHTGFVFNRATFRTLATFHYDGEGWGITRSATELITSDGTRNIIVHDGPTLIDQLNELEYINGVIYANIWHSDRIARIDPHDGHIIDWIDCTGLLPADQKIDAESVLNGIAYDAQRHRLFVTGKQWPTIFEIKIPPLSK